MPYSFENIRIIIPVKLDQSAVSDGTTIFTWKPAKKMVINSFGLIVSEGWGNSGSKVSLEVNDLEVGEATISGNTSLGTEVLGEVNPDLQVSVGDKIEFVAKDVNAETGEGYFVLEYRELP